MHWSRAKSAGIVAAVAAIIAAPAHAACSLARLAELPIVMDDSQPQTIAKINGRDARFTVDSGAFYSVISPGTAAENGLHLEAAPAGFYMTGVGGNASLSIATVKRFTLPASICRTSSSSWAAARWAAPA